MYYKRYPPRQPTNQTLASQDNIAPRPEPTEQTKAQRELDQSVGYLLYSRKYKDLHKFFLEHPEYRMDYDYAKDPGSGTDYSFKNPSFKLGGATGIDMDTFRLAMAHHPSLGEMLSGMRYRDSTALIEEVKKHDFPITQDALLDVAQLIQYNYQVKGTFEKNTYEAIMGLLASKAEPNARFHLYLGMENYEGARQAVQEGADKINFLHKNKFGKHILHNFSWYREENPENLAKWKSLCEIFSLAPGFDPNLKDSSEYESRVLSSLVYRGKYRMAKMYVDTFGGKGLDVNLKNARRGWTPIHELLHSSSSLLGIFSRDNSYLNENELAIKSNAIGLLHSLAAHGLDLDIKSGKLGKGKSARTFAKTNEGGQTIIAIATENLLRELALATPATPAKARARI